MNTFIPDNAKVVIFIQGGTLVGVKSNIHPDVKIELVDMDNDPVATTYRPEIPFTHY